MCFRCYDPIFKVQSQGSNFPTQNSCAGQGDHVLSLVTEEREGKKK